MLRTQIYLPEDLMTDLRCLAAIENVSVSEVIRKHLRTGVGQPKRKLSLREGYVGKGNAGRKTNATKEIADYYHNFGK